MAGMTINEMEEAKLGLKSHVFNSAVRTAALHGLDDYWHDLWNEAHDDDGVPTRPGEYLDRLNILRKEIDAKT